MSESILLNESVYQQLASNKKRLYLHEWLSDLDKKIANLSKQDLKQVQSTLIQQLLDLFNSFPGPALRHLIAKNISNLYTCGDLLTLYQTIEKCNNLIKSKEDKTQLNQMAKLCALNVLGSIYERLGRTAGTLYEDTIPLLFKYLKSQDDSQIKVEIIQTFEKILYGLGTAGVSFHKDLFKELKYLVQDKNMNVRSASIKCLCEMIKHSTFLYMPNSTSSQTQLTQSPNLSTNVSNELQSSVQLGIKALDNSNFDVRLNVSIYLAQLIYYSITHLQKQQLLLQQQLVNSAQLTNTSLSQNETSNQSKNQQKTIQQQQNQAVNSLIQERLKNTLNLLSNGFNKTSQLSLNLVRSSTNSNGLSEPDKQSQTSPQQNLASTNPSSTGSSSREARIGISYAYVELANLFGAQWLEKNLKLYLTHVLNLVLNTKSVQNHLDAVYSRKCVQFILRSIIGGMLNEKYQLQAANELISIIDKCLTNSTNSSSHQHILTCSIYELSCILKTLNTSASILLNEESSSLKLLEKLYTCLNYSNLGVKCVSAWCLRTIACSLPALMNNLLETCLDKLSLIRNPSDALIGYGYACSALLGAINECPLGIPSLKPKLAFNIGEELLCSASQSSNLNLALQKTSIGWLLLGSFMTTGTGLVRKHLPRLKKLWALSMPSNLEQIEMEKKRGDSFTWQVSLESRSGCLACVHSFLVNCPDLLNEGIENTVMAPINGAILLLAQLPSIIKQNNTNNINLKAQAAMFRLKLYQALIFLPNPSLYESNFAIILSELVAEFTLADQQSSNLVTSTLRSVCHSNDSILFANCWLQDLDYKTLEDQLQPHSASGCEALEHDVTYLYQKSNNTTPNSILNATTIKSLANSSFYSSLSSLYATSSNLTAFQSALPLGVAVIDASIQLYGLMYPKVPNKHRLQMLLHFNDLIQKQSTAKSNMNKQGLQINIFTAVLGSLKSLAETKSDLGDEPIRKATLKLVLDTLCHSNPILRCAAGEALGRMAQVIGESHFIIEVAQFCFDKLKNSQNDTSKTGYALGLGCLHRYVGTMGAGQQMTSSVSILFGMAQNQKSSIVQVWAIHALYLIIDSGGSMFRNYIEPCVELIVQSVLSIPYTNRDVFVGLGKLLSSLITFMGPELQMDSNNDIRIACLTTCSVMQKHTDSMIRSEAIQCLQEMNLFAPRYVNLLSLVPYLINSLVSKDFLLRKVAVSCLRQLCQKNAIDVCKIAKDYVNETKPSGLLCLINERGLEFLLFKMLDIETNPLLIRDLHDILYSLLCTSLSETTLKDWLFLCKDIGISAEESLVGQNQVKPQMSSKKSKNDSSDQIVEEETEENEELDDDSQTLQIGKQSDTDFSSKSGSASNEIGQNLKLKQITKNISPKWPNRVFAFELIRRIISMCASSIKEIQNNNFEQLSIEQLKKKAHFDLLLANKLKQKPTSNQLFKNNQQQEQEHYLILFLQDLMRIACIGATSSCDPLKLVGLDLLHDLILYFSTVEEPNPEFKGHLILEQYQAQVSATLRPQFSIETSAHVTAKACQVCSMWISSGVARDQNDIRRVHQLLVSSLQKLANNKTAQNTMLNNDNLIYSELSLTVEKLAVLRAWAEVYIIAMKKSKQDKNQSGSESLLNLVQPELVGLSKHWSVCLKDYSFLCLPIEYSNQLPIEGGAFYHADLVESSKPIYKEHFTKILLAYSIWLNEIKFEVEDMNESLNSTPPINQLNDRKEKLFFMLLGLSLETLSNTQGLAQLSDETIENILESIDYLLRTKFAKSILTKKSLYLCVEILSILYKIKLTRDVMNINLLVMNIVSQISELRVKNEKEKEENDTNKKDKEEEEEEEVHEAKESENDNDSKREKNASALIFVILEICIKDLIKYLPNLLQSTSISKQNLNISKLNSNKNSFIYLNVTKCKELAKSDIDLLKNVLNVLNKLPFHCDLNIDKKISLITIIYHILFNLIQTIDSLLNKNDKKQDHKQLESSLYSCVFESFKIVCFTSNQSLFKPDSSSLIQIQQSSMLACLNLKNVSNCIKMKLLSMYFQYSSPKLFEPLNVYEKCKVFMCSMRCSDSNLELLSMIQCLNQIISNKQTSKDMRVILLKEHLTYLLKLTTSNSAQSFEFQNLTNLDFTYSDSSFISLSNQYGLELITSLLDLIESMLSLMNDDNLKQNETLTIYVHLLSMYLKDDLTNLKSDLKQKSLKLNDLVIKKLVNLGLNYKQELKLVLDKYPDLKQKILNAHKLNSNPNQTTETNQNESRHNFNNKAPKIQLNFNFSKR